MCYCLEFDICSNSVDTKAINVFVICTAMLFNIMDRGIEVVVAASVLHFFSARFYLIIFFSLLLHTHSVLLNFILKELNTKYCSKSTQTDIYDGNEITSIQLSSIFFLLSFLCFV